MNCGLEIEVNFNHFSKDLFQFNIDFLSNINIENNEMVDSTTSSQKDSS